MNPAAESQTLLIGRILLGLLFPVAGIRIILSYSGNIGYFTKLGSLWRSASATAAIVLSCCSFQVPHAGARAIIKSGDAAGICQCQHVVGGASSSVALISCKYLGSPPLQEA